MLHYKILFSFLHGRSSTLISYSMGECISGFYRQAVLSLSGHCEIGGGRLWEGKQQGFGKG